MGCDGDLGGLGDPSCEGRISLCVFRVAIFLFPFHTPWAPLSLVILFLFPLYLPRGQLAAWVVSILDERAVASPVVRPLLLFIYFLYPYFLGAGTLFLVIINRSFV